MRKYDSADFTNDYRNGAFTVNGMNVTYVENPCAAEYPSVEIIHFEVGESDEIKSRPFKSQQRHERVELLADMADMINKAFHPDTVYLTDGEADTLRRRWESWLRLNRKYNAIITPFSACGENLRFRLADRNRLVKMANYCRPGFLQGLHEVALGDDWYLYRGAGDPSYRRLERPDYPYTEISKFKDSNIVLVSDTTLIEELRGLATRLREEYSIGFVITPDLSIELRQNADDAMTFWYFCYEDNTCYFLYRHFRIPASADVRNLLFEAENRLNAGEYDLIAEDVVARDLQKPVQ
jgi:hypothetical protein